MCFIQGWWFDKTLRSTSNSVIQNLLQPDENIDSMLPTVFFFLLWCDCDLWGSTASKSPIPLVSLPFHPPVTLWLLWRVNYAPPLQLRVTPLGIKGVIPASVPISHKSSLIAMLVNWRCALFRQVGCFVGSTASCGLAPFTAKYLLFVGIIFRGFFFKICFAFCNFRTSNVTTFYIYTGTTRNI